MKNIHIVIPDLFLPQPLAMQACADLQLPALEKLLVHARAEPLLADTVETWLCGVFGIKEHAIAPVTLQADGMEPGNSYWLRADPVHLHIRKGQLILQPEVLLGADEAAQLCAALNVHFMGEGLHFCVPHPQRWYLQLDDAPAMQTRSLAQAAGQNVHAHLPQGQDALRWHGIFNEIQMVFHEHAVNQAREARGDLPVNSVWLWGGGAGGKPLARPFTRVCGDNTLAEACAQAAGIPCAPLPGGVHKFTGDENGEVLLVWEGLHRAIQHGDLHAWRTSLRNFEQYCAAPLLDALRGGRIEQVTLDVPNAGGARRFVLARGALWKIWRRARRLTHYALV